MKHLRIKPTAVPTNEDYAAGIFIQIANEEVEEIKKGKTTRRLLTDTEKGELLKEKIKELPFNPKKKNKISDAVERMFEWYEPIVQYTTPKALQDWVDQDYDKNFDYRGYKIDSLDLGMIMLNGFYRSQHPISSLPDLNIVTLCWDDGSVERDLMRLIKNFKYDFENKLDRHYFIFPHITTSDRIGNLTQNRINFSKSIEEWINYLCKQGLFKRDRIHIIGYLPQDPTKRVDSSMSSIIDYVEFKRDNGI